MSGSLTNEYIYGYINLLIEVIDASISERRVVLSGLAGRPTPAASK
jgi:hypothetical protein